METPIARKDSPIAEKWLAKNCLGALEVLEKETGDTRAWFGCFDGKEVFAKLFPKSLDPERSLIEAEVSGGNLHPAIVPLQSVIECKDGRLHLYNRVAGESLSSSPVRHRFEKLPIAERTTAILTVLDALAAICSSGFTVVDWYDGNMLYDFETRTIWLFDWELCRRGACFELEMDSNYGSSRFQAPEEFIRGSRIDEQTLVYNLGRYVLLTLPELAEPLASLLSRATYPSKTGRLKELKELGDGLRSIRTELP